MAAHPFLRSSFFLPIEILLDHNHIVKLLEKLLVDVDVDAAAATDDGDDYGT
jgi:hypothetical protein